VESRGGAPETSHFPGLRLKNEVLAAQFQHRQKIVDVGRLCAYHCNAATKSSVSRFVSNWTA
jgi:hypothetical protein